MYPFHGLETEYQQQKYFKEKFSINVSTKCSCLELASFNKVMAQILMGELVDSLDFPFYLFITQARTVAN